MNKLILGTVQFGIDYGATNKDGQVSKETAHQILEYALSKNVSTCDTASGYGESEEILGFFPEIHRFKVITKSAPDLSLKDLDQLEIKTKDSLKKLNIEKLEGLMLHRPSILYKDTKQKVLRALESLKEKGLFCKYGVSLYDPEELDSIFELNIPVDIIQIPFNLFDQRFLTSGLIKEAKKRNIEVHVRSIFLQGVLLSKKGTLNSYFDIFKEHFEKYYLFLEENQISPLEAIFGLINSTPEIDKALVGVCSLEQLKEIEKNQLKASNFSFHALASSNKKLTDPRLWEIN